VVHIEFLPAAAASLTIDSYGERTATGPMI